MYNEHMTIGFIGLGKMGKNMSIRLVSQGIDVVAWNRSEQPREDVAKHGVKTADSLPALVSALSGPRIIWIMLTAGDVVDAVLSEILPLLSSGDMVVDGGNSFYKDSVRRAQTCAGKGVHFVDVGVSGGPSGAHHGACLMVGGDRSDFDTLVPVFRALAAPDAYAYVGKSGAGHFVKMVHNGIEYGMMQAIAEGAAVLKKSPFTVDMAEVFRIYNNSSVIESRLVGWAHDAFAEDSELSSISSSISHTGEGAWTVEAAKELGVSTPVIDASLEVRKKSKEEPENYRNKVVSALRGKFGGHDVSKA